MTGSDGGSIKSTQSRLYRSRSPAGLGRTRLTRDNQKTDSRSRVRHNEFPRGGVPTYYDTSSDAHPPEVERLGYAPTVYIYQLWS